MTHESKNYKIEGEINQKSILFCDTFHEINQKSILFCDTFHEIKTSVEP